METYRSLVALVSLLSLFQICPAQNGQFKMRRVLPPPGLQTEIHAGVQDSQGYMWFGTDNGLYRYDGYNYTPYFDDPLNSNSLVSHHVETVYAGRNGIIWIGTREGLDRFNPATGIFTHFFHDQSSSSLSNHEVKAIFEDHEGMIWVGTHKGLNRLDPKTNTITRFLHNASDPTTISNDQVRIIYEDKQGILWIGTGSAFGENKDKSPLNGGLNRFDRKTATFTRYLHDPLDPRSLADSRVKAIFEDSRGTFWVGTAGDGLHTMDRVKGTFERYTYDPLHPEKLSRPAQKKIGYWADDHITFITEDITGAIWIGTFGNGINKYDPNTKKVTHLRNGEEKIGIEYLDAPWWTCTTRDGVLWIGYWENLYKVDPLQTNIPYISVGGTVYSIYEDAAGMLWYGGDFGLIRRDHVKRTEQHFSHKPNDSLSLSNTAFSIYEDRQGVLWIGTNNGILNRFNKKNGSFTQYKIDRQSDRSIPAYNDIKCMYEDWSGNFWIGTYEDGLKTMNRQTGTILHYRHNPGDSHSISANRIKRIYEDKGGNLWIGTYGGGLNRMTSVGKFQHFLQQADVNSILEDADGVLWVATSFGLYRKDQKSGNFKHFVYPGTQMTQDIVISGLLEDNHNALWINSSIGILKLNRKRNELIIYGENHGVNTQRSAAFTDAGCFKGKQGELFFGDSNGYYSFFPEQLSRNEEPPQIIITQFRIGDKILKLSKEGPLKKPLSAIKEIRLQHDQNFFSLDFTGIHYSNSKENKHLFMLKGLDENWHVAGDQRTAYYSKVPPGNYTFRVKASNSDGVWAEKSISVVVLPPWWNTLWFEVIAGACIILSGYALMRWRIRQKFHLQLEHSKNEKQLAELQQQKTELEMQALRAQMNPHFIFNSLNSINRFILQNNRAQASQYLTKFSRLVRLILQNSQAALIPLECEMESLQLYLELERLRFDDHFSFKIIIGDELDTEIIKIPPLIIQPFAENAIWHGLMPKEEKGCLQVELFQNEEMLCCKITDDGIGRKKAEALKDKSSSIHKSMGLRITAERIAMLQQQNQVKSSVQITDLVLPDGSAGGTEVLLKIPLMFD